MWLALATAACSSRPEPETKIGRLDIELRDMSVKEEPSVSPENLPGARLMFRAMGYDTITPELLQWWSQSDVVQVFQHDVDSTYIDLKSLQLQLASITDSAQKNKLGLPEMKFYTITWGKPQPLMRDSDVLVIALNHYLGADYAGYSHWEDFRRRTKTPEMLPYDISAALAATQVPMSHPEDAPLIDWMLYEGALAEARMRMVENADLATALGYTPEQLKWCREHYDEMMREMAARKMLYDTDPVLIDRMLASSPASPLMSGTAPGRVGRYIGYRLVEDYMKKHPSATLPELLSLTSKDVR